MRSKESTLQTFKDRASRHVSLQALFGPRTMVLARQICSTLGAVKITERLSVGKSSALLEIGFLVNRAA